MAEVAVIGAGISGLSAAWELARSGVEVVVLEASDRAGGVIASREANGFLMESGPDAFLRHKPAALELCRELGLEDEVIPTLAVGSPARVLRRGRLHPLPAGWRLLAPTRLGPMLRTPLLGWPAKLSLALHWAGQSTPAADGDESVAAWLRRRYGKLAGQALGDRLAGPMLAGVYGGDVETLSLASAAPRPSGPAAARPSAGEGGTMFASLRPGMGSLPAALVRHLEASASARLRFNCAVAGIEAIRLGFRISCADGERLDAERVIVAVPAPRAAELLAGVDPELASALSAIPFGSSLNINLGFRQKLTLPPGTGFLAPRGEGVRMLACTFAHQKFGGRAPANGSLLRLFYSGEVMSWGDEQVASLARQELAAVAGVRGEPQEVQIQRWPASMPQYTVGHAARVGAIQASLARHRGLALAGNAYGGVGIPDCIASGREAARGLMAPVPA